MAVQDKQQKILILATETCAYPGANAVGQAHMSYPTNTYILLYSSQKSSIWTVLPRG